MKFFHLADLHLGKRIHEVSLLADQAHILEKIVDLAREHRPDAVLICGDVYDKSVPSVEATLLLDRFVVSLRECDTSVYIIAGNHDSVERLSFASCLLEQSRLHIAQAYQGKLTPIVEHDSFGSVAFWLLPFLKPAMVRPFFNDEKIGSAQEALQVALRDLTFEVADRHVLLAHQFVTGARTSESEDFFVGTVQNVDATSFERFDYVALGHLHRPQFVGGERLRYAGSPLAYSFSESSEHKTLTMVTLGQKGALQIEELPLHPLHPMRKVKGTFSELRDQPITEDYLHITLTDEEIKHDAVRILRVVYPNLMQLTYENKRTKATTVVQAAQDIEHKSHTALVEELYLMQNGQPLGEKQRAFVTKLFEQILEQSR